MMICAGSFFVKKYTTLEWDVENWGSYAVSKWEISVLSTFQSI
jgi:hypothetical protein